MIGTIVNTAAVILGGSIGLLLKTGMPDRIKTIYFQAVGLFTLAIGIGMVWNMEHIIKTCRFYFQYQLQPEPLGVAHLLG